MVVYCFLGFTGKRTKRYTGFSALIRELEARGHICRIFTHPEGEEAVNHYLLYDKGEALSVVGHSLGADAGKIFCYGLRKLGHRPLLYIALDFVPHSVGKHILCFLSHLSNRILPEPEKFHSGAAAQVVHFYQRKFCFWNMGTWPQGRILVDQHGKEHNNQLILDVNHCTIDASRFVWEMIFSLLDNAARKE